MDYFEGRELNPYFKEEVEVKCYFMRYGNYPTCWTVKAGRSES